MIYQSTDSNRGVAILINKKLKCEIIMQNSDHISNNFIIAKIRCQSKEMAIGAIYGPNHNDLEFYDNLKNAIESMNCPDIIISGDWNATWDNSNVDTNIDVLNMRDIPSKQRSDKLQQICNELALTDPFRVFFPTKKAYTYIPSNPLFEN